MTAATLDRTVWRTAVAESVSAIKWSTIDDLLAVADLGGQVTLMNGGDGQPLKRGALHPGGAIALSWQPGQGQLASGGADGRVALHDGETGDASYTEIGGWVHALLWSPNGNRLAVAAGRSLVLLDPAGKVRQRWDGQPSTVTDVVWSRDGRRVGCAAYGGMRWYTADPASAEPVREFAWKGSLLLARVSPDGNWVASGNQDASVHVWRLWTGDDAEMTGYPEKVDALAFDRTSRWMANGGTDEISIWDFTGKGPMGRAPKMLPGHDAQVSALAWQPTGDLLASGGRDGGIAWWAPGPKVRKTEPRHRMDLPGRVTSLAWSRDGATCAAATVSGAVVAVHP